MEWAKRDGILTAAAKAFQGLGFRKTSIDEIAKAAGVAKGTIYLACTSKEDLFYQVLHREIRAWVAAVSKALDPRLPADELLRRASDMGIEYLDSHPLVRSLLFGECRRLLPSWSDRFDALAELGKENVVEILKLGQKQGVFREDLDVEEVAQLLLDLQIAFFVLHDRAPDWEAKISRRRSAGFDLIMNGLRRVPAPKTP